jgi:hypothetical protein
MFRLWFGLLVRSFRARRSLVIHQNLAEGFEAFARGGTTDDLTSITSLLDTSHG